MRKVKSIISCLVIMSVFCMTLFINPSIVSAADITVQVWTIGISVNDVRTQGSSKAVFYNNDIFVPVKYLSSSMKMSYIYNNADGMISLKRNSPTTNTTPTSLDSLKTGGGIPVKIWTIAINIDGKRAVGNAQAVFYGGDVFVPAKYLSNNIGLEYSYSDKDGMIRLKSTTLASTPSPIVEPTPAKSPQPTPQPTQKPTIQPTSEPTKDLVVYVTNTGEKYHTSSCRYLSKSKIAINLSDAKAQGYGACKVCTPPQ